MELKYGFIGAGNMGGAILRGALAGGALAAEETAVFGVQKVSLRIQRRAKNSAVY